MLFNFETPFAAPGPIVEDPTLGQIAIEAEKAHPSPPLPPPSVAEARAAEAIFAAANAEAQMMMGLWGMWTGTALLHDLMIEHLGKRSGQFDEEEAEREAEQREKQE